MASILLVFAHPADESFFCAGTVAKYSRRGHKVHLVSATRGEVGLDGRKLRRPADQSLAKAQEGELRKAAQILGIGQIYFLDFIDGQLKNLEPKVIQNKILAVIHLTQPNVVVSFGKDGVSEHPNHQVIGRATRALFTDPAARGLLAETKLYEVCLPFSTTQKVQPNWANVAEGRISTVVNIDNTWFLKKQALLAHASKKESVEKVFGPGVEPKVAELKKFEYFKRVYPVWRRSWPKEAELF